jgi:hypothetical protein
MEWLASRSQDGRRNAIRLQNNENNFAAARRRSFATRTVVVTIQSNQKNHRGENLWITP